MIYFFQLLRFLLAVETDSFSFFLSLFLVLLGWSSSWSSSSYFKLGRYGRLDGANTSSMTAA